MFHLLGLDNPGGAWYLFWSGIFGDATIFAALGLLYYKHSCHHDKCYRIAKHIVNGSPFCTKHLKKGK